MIFEDKLTEQFDKLKLKVPHESKHLTHLYVDYVELIALFSNDSVITRGDLIDRLQDEGILEVEEGDEVLNEVGSDTAEQRDEHEAKVSDIFRIIEERTHIFGTNYPFSFSDNHLKLRQNLTFKQELYLMLLIASNLDIFSKVKSELTAEFETVSYYTLKNYLASNAVVKEFGENSTYTGNTKEKISQLADELGLEINEYEWNKIADQNTKERGLDIIGWVPFSDNTPNFLAILGQCACGKEWFKKQNETKRVEEYLRFYKLPPVHSLFIPYSIVEMSKGFYQSDEINKGSLIFERNRIVELFDNEDAFSSMLSKQVVQKSIEFEEDIV